MQQRPGGIHVKLHSVQVYVICIHQTQERQKLGLYFIVNLWKTVWHFWGYFAGVNLKHIFFILSWLIFNDIVWKSTANVAENNCYMINVAAPNDCYHTVSILQELTRFCLNWIEHTVSAEYGNYNITANSRQIAKATFLSHCAALQFGT